METMGWKCIAFLIEGNKKERETGAKKIKVALRETNRVPTHGNQPSAYSAGQMNTNLI